jgi:hypothetical protein
MVGWGNQVGKEQTMMPPEGVMRVAKAIFDESVRDRGFPVTFEQIPDDAKAYFIRLATAAGIEWTKYIMEGMKDG